MQILLLRKYLMPVLGMLWMSFISSKLVAQSPANSPSGGQVPAASATPVTRPVAYSTGIKVNYVRTWEPQQAMADEAAVVSSTDVGAVHISTQYIDGLGRPLQTVTWQSSPSKKDIVSPVFYDAYGREQYKYLPYTSTSFDGSFKLDPFGEQNTFFSSTYPAEQPAYGNEQFYYSHTNFEVSPLNRVTKTFAPGNSWAGSEGGTSEKSTQTQYLNNTDAEAIPFWNISTDALTYTGNDVTTNIPSSTAAYAAGMLSKTVIIDEQGHAVVEYKDKDGHVVLKKVQVAATVPTDYSGFAGFLNTIYIYDDLEQLRFVIQPRAIALLQIAGNWTLTANMINELCFRYEYDARQRMIAKKVPGAGWVYMIYDKRDRSVFTQDANMRLKNQWLGSLYDALNRQIETFMLNYTGGAVALQNYVNANTGNSTFGTETITGTTPTSGLADIFINNRQVGLTLYQASNSITFGPGFISESGANFTAIINPSAGGGSFSNTQTVVDNPIPTGSVYFPLTLTNYDDYHNTSKTYNSSNNSKLDQPGETLPSSASVMTKGIVTSTKVRVIENANDLTIGQWLETTSFYDDKARAVQVQSDNYKGGVDVVTSRYDFISKVVSTYQVHNNPAGSISNLRVKTNMEYDHMGRLLTVKKNINDDLNASSLTTTQRTVATYIYDALGQLKQKKLGQKTASGSAPAATPMEDDSYAYNIRGWLKGTNWNYPNSGSTTTQVSNTANKWFGMDLSYDWGYTGNQYNGNIAGERWVSAGDGAERSYGFGYDAVNRLLFADFKQNFGSTWAITDPGNSNFTINFSVKMGDDGINPSTAYDENGNILKMQQNGLVLSSSQLMDNLAYSYEYSAASNKLRAVSDGGVQPTANLGDFNDKNTTADDYGYDQNGNMVTDLNKRINGNTGVDVTGGGPIVYNYMNLPWQITVKNDDASAKGTITYIYDALGNKLEKRTAENASAANNNTAKQTVTTYLGSFQYENNVLQFFGQEEGRIRPVTATAYNNNQLYAYDYFLKDHLGNTRSVLTDELQQDLYPAATLEDGAVTTESNYYNINVSNIVATPSYLTTSYYNNNGNPPYNTNPNSNTAATSTKMYRINGSTGDKTGLGVALKVMTGDVIDIYGKSFWHNGGPDPVNTYPVSSVLTSFISAFAGSPAVAGSGHGLTGAALNGSGATTSGLTGWLNSVPNPAMTSVPKAYINWILFDEQFKPVTIGGGSSYDLVSTTADQLKLHHNTVTIPKGGYLYVYCSNESNLNVFFDNLQVIQTRSPLTEENHYYPFGLTMAGISSKAAGKLENKVKFEGKELQHQEFTDGSGLETYDFNARQYDPQTGKWNSIDLMADKREWLTPYNFVQNNPLKRVDPTGTFDFVKGANGNLKWDKNANSQSSTKAGETYVGKNLNFNFTSYIDKKLWDGPNPPGGDATGVKLITTVNITGNENEKGELTSISAGKHVKVGTTPIGTARSYYPGLGDDQNKFSLTSGPGGVNLNVEQHSSVSPIEEYGLSLMGYNVVNVAQKLDVNISSQGNVAFSATTDIFPSATLTLNGSSVMQYNQPSYKATHTKGQSSNFVDNGMGGATRESSYLPASWNKK